MQEPDKNDVENHYITLFERGAPVQEIEDFEEKNPEFATLFADTKATVSLGAEGTSERTRMALTTAAVVAGTISIVFVSFYHAFESRNSNYLLAERQLEFESSNERILRFEKTSPSPSLVTTQTFSGQNLLGEAIIGREPYMVCVTESEIVLPADVRIRPPNRMQFSGPVDFSPSARWVAAAMSGPENGLNSIFVWEFGTGRSRSLSTQGRIWHIDFLGDERMVVSFQSELTVVDAEFGESGKRLGVESEILAVETSPDGMLVSLATRTGEVLLWDWQREEAPSRRFRRHENVDVHWNAYLAFSADSKAMCFARPNGEIQVINVANNVTTVLPGNSGIVGCSMTSSDRVIVVDVVGRLYLWDVSTRRLLRMTKVPADVQPIALSSDSTFLMTRSIDTVENRASVFDFSGLTRLHTSPTVEATGAND